LLKNSAVKANGRYFLVIAWLTSLQMIAYVPFVAISSPVGFVLSYQTCSAYQAVICTNSGLSELSITHWIIEKVC
jgi:hypothetical protein